MRVSNARFYAMGYVRARLYARPPIVIGGCERSGTTLLQSILSAHPRIHAIADELWAFCHGPPAGFRGDRPIRMSRLYKYLGQHRPPPGARRWCEKSPANIFYFDAILDHFGGRVRLIQIVRDGRDVVSSMHPKNTTKPWVSIDRWVASVTAGLPFREHPSVLTIRYEDLIQDYEPTATSICAFLEEDFAPQLRDWHAHARIRQSENLRGSRVGDIHASSIRKFDAPDFQHGAVVDELLARPDARSLLETYGFEP